MYNIYTKLKKSQIIDMIKWGKDVEIAYCGSKINPYLHKDTISTTTLNVFDGTTHFDKWAKKKKEQLCDEDRGKTLSFYLIEKSKIRVWTVEEIKSRLKSSNEMVLKGVLLIYSLQSQDEMTFRECTRVNGIGFNKYDIDFMSSIAEQIIIKGNLTMTQMISVRKIMMKYALQLTKISNGELNANKSILRHIRKM